ncbi:hypothetical protein ASPCAL09469 [Aspergillus calidoustus]|uniref:Uncharacterized protein n=1 Tax=Aspergillus calidoustus TaxID=454130 RepID=A0A0U5HMG8_ASPCI|nr:hypothetical protein ASPCAL09469 [Aspergillus calidoustus]
MGQRHNRRRTRPRSRNRSANIRPVPLDTFSIPADLCAASCLSDLDCLGNRPASTRHYRGLSWQDREHALKPEAAMLETEQYRLFGGEPGDDVGLCYRMLEYFGGLDYIDPLQDFRPLPG